MIIFYLFASLAILGSLTVVLTKNPVYAVLSLIFVFLNVASLFVLIGAEFMAMALVIIYVGAVAVLFLFIVMMINIRNVSKGFTKANIISVMLIGLLLANLVLMISSADYNHFLNNESNEYYKTPNTEFQIKLDNEFQGEAAQRTLRVREHDRDPQNSSGSFKNGTRYNTHAIGEVLYTDFVIHFQTAGLILFAAMVGCIYLSLPSKRSNKNKKNIDHNLEKGDRVKFVKVTSREGIDGIKY